MTLEEIEKRLNAVNSKLINSSPNYEKSIAYKNNKYNTIKATQRKPLVEESVVDKAVNGVKNTFNLNDGYQIGDLTKGAFYTAPKRSLDTIGKEVPIVNTTRTTLKNFGKNLFQVPENWKDGYQFGDIAKTIGGSTADAGLNIYGSVSQMVEGLAQKLPGQAWALIEDAKGNTEKAKKIREYLKDEKNYLSTDVKNFREKYFEPYSIYGSSSDQVASGIGSTIGSAGLSMLPGGSVNIGKLKDVPIAMGIAEMGNSVNENYSKEDITNAQAWLNGAGKGVVSALSESIFGAFGVGGSELDDALVKGVTKNLDSQLAKGLAQLGIKAGGEACEEFLEYAGDYIVNYATDMISAGKGAQFAEEWNNEEVLQSMISAFLSTSLTQGGSTIQNIARGTDVITGNTKATQEQIDQEVNTQKQALEQEGKKVGIPKLLELEQQATEKVYLQQGKASTSIKVVENENLTDNEKDMFLNMVESSKNLNELNGINRLMNLDYKDKTGNVTQEQVQKITENYLASAKANNIDVNNVTVQSMLEIATARGFEITYDKNAFNNSNEGAKWTVDDNGNRKVFINPNANNETSLQNLTVHELTHDLENTEDYKVLSDLVLDFAEKRGFKNSEAETDLRELYKNELAKYDTKEKQNAFINSELVANILGTQLGNQEFINHLTISNRQTANVLYNWVVDKLNKLNRLTGYKFEKLYWADVKNKFDKAFKADFNNYKGESKLSKSNNVNKSETDNKGRQLTQEQQEYFKDSKVRDSDGNLKTMYHGTEANVGIPKEYWFSVFDKDRQGNHGSWFGNGFYFTENEEHARDYAHSKGNVYEVYLNIKNPYIPYQNGDSMLSFQEDFKNNFDEARQIADKLSGEQITAILKENGYDGIIIGNNAIVFDSNQIKNIDNTNPTDNPDIRYSKQSTGAFNEWLGKNTNNKVEKPVNVPIVNDYYNGNSGYKGQAMSERAIDAYREGKKPLSKFNSQDLNYFNSKLAEIGVEERVKTVKELKELMQKYNDGEWHHTGKYFNQTNFYDTDYILENYDNDEISKAILKNRGEYKNSEQEQKNLIKQQEYQKQQEEEQKRYEERKEKYTKLSTDKMYKNSTESAKEILNKYNIKSIATYEGDTGSVLSTYDGKVQVSESGNIYLDNTKPTKSDYENGLENHFKIGNKRLSPLGKNSENGYRVETWNGREWISESTSNKNASNKNQAPTKQENKINKHKEEQLKIVQETNPMFNDTSVGIRTIEDIQTFEECIKNADKDSAFVWGDYSKEDAIRDLKNGKITIYSSYPIKNGVFVSTSYQQAFEYAGHDASKVHQRVVKLDNVAWINGDEGQYAKVKPKVDANKVENKLINNIANNLMVTREQISDVDIYGEAQKQAGKEFKNFDTDDGFDNYYKRINEIENKIRDKLVEQGYKLQDNTYIKTGKAPTKQVVDNKGRQLTQEQQEYFKNSKVRDENGNLLEVYHGTNKAGFNEIEGKLYLTDDITIARDYAGGDIIYDPNNPNSNLTPIATEGKKSYWKPTREIINHLEEYTLRDIISMYDYIDSNNTMRDAVEEYNLNKPITELKKELDKFDVEYINEMLDFVKNEISDEEYLDKSLPIPPLKNEKNNTTNVLTENRKIYKGYANITNPLIIDKNGGKILYNEIEEAKAKGYDGIIAYNTGEGRGNKKGNTYIIFNSNQFKNIDNSTPTTNPDIRYSKQSTGAFNEWLDKNTSNNKTKVPIKKVVDNEGRQLTKQQQEYFKDSKVRNEKGELTTVYHTTTDKTTQFNEFNPVGTTNYRFGDQVVNYYTDSKEMSSSYAQYEYIEADTDTKTIKNYKDAIKWLNDNQFNRNFKTQIGYDIQQLENGSIKLNIYDYNSGESLGKYVYDSENDFVKNIKNNVYEVALGKKRIQYKGYINIKNPYIVNVEGRNWNEVKVEIDSETKNKIKSELNKIFGDSDNKRNLIDLAKESKEKYKNYEKSVKSDINKKIIDTAKDLSRGKNSDIKSIIDDCSTFGFDYEDYSKKYKELNINLPSGDTKVKDILVEYMEKHDANDIKNREYKLTNYGNMTLNEFLKMAYTAYSEEYAFGRPENYFKQKYYDYTNHYYGDGDIFTEEQLYRLAENSFSDNSIAEIFGEKKTTNDIVNEVIEKNKNGANYDGIIMKNLYDYGFTRDIDSKPADVYVTFNSNQFKAVDNTTPTSDKDIRYSKNSNGEFGNWVDKNTNNTGTQTKVSDVLLPENIRNIKDEIREKINTTGDLDTELKKDLRKLVDNTNDEKQLKKYLDDINELNETSNSKEKTFVPIKGTIKINNYKNAKINQKIVDTALDMVKPNRQGNRTKDQWLQVAEQIGLNAPPDKIDVYANKTWLDLRPYDSLNKQGKRSVYFKKDDWINAVNKGAETTIANIDSTEVQNINKVLENKDIVNDAKDNETLLNEITGKETRNKVKEVVKDSSGKALEVYHGTPVSFDKFDSTKAGTNTNTDFTGMYFTDNVNVANDFSYEQLPGNSNLTYKRGNKGNIYKANLLSSNSLDLNHLTNEDIEGLRKYLDSNNILDSEDNTIEMMKKMNDANNIHGLRFYLDLSKVSKDYDMVISDMGGDYKGSNEYIVFDESQISKIDDNKQNSNEKFAKVPTASMDKQIENMKAKSDEKAQQLLRGVDVSIKRGTKNSIVVSNDNSVAVSKHGNLYFYGTKPTAKDYIKTGLDATLEKGTLRLVPKEANNVDAGLRTEEWTGEKWEDYYEVSNKRSQQWAKEAFEDSNESNESPTLQFIKDARNQDKATVKQVIDAYMQKIVNSGHYIDQLADKVNNPELKYANDKRLSTYGEAQYSIGVAQTDIHGNEIGKSLIDIFKPVEQAGLKNEFNDYLLNRLNIERQVVEKAIFGDEITSQKSRKIIRDYEEAHPEFKEWAQDVYTFNRNELQNLVDAGLVSKDTQELFRKMYGDYVPVHRILEEVYEKGNKTTKETGVSNPVKRAKGGYQEILDIETAMAENVLSSKKAIAMNELGKQLAISLGHKNILEDMGYEPKWTPDAIMNLNGDVVINEDGKYLYTIYTNGEMKQFALTKELYEGLRKDTIQNKINNSKIAKRILDPFEKATKLQRDVLTTYSVGFLLNNPIKDFQDGLFYTKYSAGQFLKNYSVALKEIATKGKYYKQYMALGGQDNSFFEYGKGIKQEAKGFKKVLAKIEQMNSVLETAPRLAEFISSIENGASVNEAMYNASDITTNFKRGGEYTKLANKYGMNFLNASVQGFDKFMRTMKVTDAKSAFRLVARVASMGILPALLNGFMYKDDDDYENLEDYIKDEYYLIKLNDDGDFLRIPKGRVLATISSATRTVIEGAQGDLDLKSFKDEAIKQLAPGNPLENNIVAPLIQAYNNKTWYKTDLVPKRLQNQLPKYQYNEKTDKISMWLGENLNISPIKINYLIDQYSGGFGDLILPMLTPQAENNIITDKFTTSAVMKNKTVGEFYDALDKYEKLKNSPNATEEETTKYAYLSKVSSKVGKLYAQKRDIQMDSTLSDKEKKELVKDVQREINAYTECAMDLLNGEYNENTKWNMYTEGIISDKVRESDGNSALQDALYIVNNGIATKGEYMEMYQLAKNNNVSIPTMNKLVEMKNNNVKLTTYTDFMIGTKEFKADRDEDDKAIAGTLNAKKATYIMDMDATKEQKNGLLNMLSEGASYDDLKKLKGNYTMYFKQSGKRPTSGGLSAREKYMSFINAGISPDQLDAYYTGISQIKGSNKKQAVFNFINSLKLTIPQKMMLLAKQYKNFRKLYVKDIVAYIKGLKVSKQEKIKMIYSIFYS